MSDCARYAPMLSARPGELGPIEQAGLDAHLGTCNSCRKRLGDERLTVGLVGEVLLAEASQRDFSGFAGAVLARIPEPARARNEAAREPFWRRRWALAGVLAPALAALALIVYVVHPVVFSESPQAGEVEVSVEGRATMVIQTSDGPVVLLGDPDEPEGT